MYRTPSNMQSVLNGGGAGHRQSRAGNTIDVQNRFNEDQKSDWGESQGPDGRALAYQMNNLNRQQPGDGLVQSRQKPHAGNSTSRM